ncbi:MAG: SPASM domain-containing protein [Bacilli bacterium]|nr:SPASM domain-containing protein [Bacilli bacterium]
MSVLSLLIKPASGQCNLSCSYCFYHDLMKEKGGIIHEVMTYETLGILLKEAFKLAKKALILSFQGGEPLLVGLKYYEEVIHLVKTLNKSSIPVSYSIQTNGLLLDDEWCAFLEKHHFLVGISLDGPKEVHEVARGSHHNQILEAVHLLERYHVPFNILAVVTKANVQKASEIYQFFRKEKLFYLQFIPCVPLHNNENKEQTLLTDQEYFHFLDELFHCWFYDIMGSNPTSIRLFDNLVAILLGLKPNSCDLNGSCSSALIIESNGDVYPCDFFVEKDYLLGNILKKPLEQIITSPIRSHLYEVSTTLPLACVQCPYRYLCQGGCVKYRTPSHIYCKTMYLFLQKNLTQLEEVATYFKQQIRS